MKPIPYGRQNINEADIRAVVDVLQSDWITQGPAIDRFEKTVGEYCGARFAVAVNSGTSALHLACRALDLGLNDVLWTTPNTFVATANCALYCGAGVDFVDIDPLTYNMSVAALEQKLEKASRGGRLPKIVMPVHFAGQPCEMKSIRALVDHYGFSIVVDASHALGARYRGESVGSCRFSDLTIFSFHPVKIITTGEGGLVLTNKEALGGKMKLLRNHGLTRDPSQMTGPLEGPWYYQQIDLGYNFRMTDIQAALGISQMNRIDEFIQRRRSLARRYDQAFKDLPLTIPWQHPDSFSSYHLYVVRLHLQRIKKTRTEVFNEMREKGVLVNVHYIPLHTHPYYQKKFGFKKGDFPAAEKYYEEAITLPLYPALSEEDQDRVIKTLSQCLQ